MAADRTLALGVDSRGAQRGYSKARREARRFTGSARKSVQATDNLDSSFGRAGRRARAFATALGSIAAVVGAGALARGLININREFERLNAQLRTTEQSAAGAEAAFDRIIDFAVKTPFEVDNLTQAFVQLRIRGAEPTNRELTALGNIASSFSRDITDVSAAVSSATAGMTRPLRRFGFEASVAEDQITLAFDGMERTVDRNAQAIITAMSELTSDRLAGAMAREMDTVNGIVSNFMDNVGRLARAIGEEGLNDAIFGVVKRFESLVGTLADNRAAIRATMDATVALVQALGLATGVGLAWAAVQVATNIGGAAVAFAQLTTSARTLADVLALLRIAMGPTGWIIAGVTAVAGAIFAWRRGQREISAELENTRQKLIDQREELDTNRVVIEDATKAMDDFREARVRMLRSGLSGRRGVPDAPDIPDPAPPTGAGAVEVQRERIELLVRGRELTALTREETEELFRAEVRIRRVLAEGIEDLERRVAIQELLNDVTDDTANRALALSEITDEQVALVGRVAGVDLSGAFEAATQEGERFNQELLKAEAVASLLVDNFARFLSDVAMLSLGGVLQTEVSRTREEMSRLRLELDAGRVSEAAFESQMASLNKELAQAQLNANGLAEAFKSMASSILSDLTRMIARAAVFSVLMEVIAPGSFIGRGLAAMGGNFAGGFAHGGTIPAGQLGLVAEAGEPEMISRPSLVRGPAQVTPQGQGGGGRRSGPGTLDAIRSEVSNLGQPMTPREQSRDARWVEVVRLTVEHIEERS